MKRCTKCKVEKDVSNFHPDTRYRSGLFPICRECRNAQRRQYDIAYRKTDKRKAMKKAWYQSEKGKEYRRQYEKKYALTEKRQSLMHRHRHTDRYREVIRVNVQKKRATDLQFRLTLSLRSRLIHAVRTGQKNGSAVRDLGCSIAEFKKYIESKFQIGMTWKNWSRSGWHLDHIVPLASFDLTKREQLLKACHYTNIQPLWAKDNFKKGCR